MCLIEFPRRRRPYDILWTDARCVIPEPVDSHVPCRLAGANSSTNNTPPLVWQLASEDDLSMEEVVVADLNFCNSVVGGPTSTPLNSAGLIVDLAGDVTVGVSSPAELAGDVTVGVSSPANLAGYVTVCVSFPADLAGDVTVGVSFPAEIAGDVTVGVSSPANLAGYVTVCVSFPADLAGDVTIYFDDGHYDDRPDYLTMMIRATMIVILVCMVLLGRIIMSCIMICMARIAVGVYCVSRGNVGVVPYWIGYEEGDVYAVMLPCPGPVPMSRSIY